MGMEASDACSVAGILLLYLSFLVLELLQVERHYQNLLKGTWPSSQTTCSVSVCHVIYVTVVLGQPVQHTQHTLHAKIHNQILQWSFMLVCPKPLRSFTQWINWYIFPCIPEGKGRHTLLINFFLDVNMSTHSRSAHSCLIITALEISALVYFSTPHRVASLLHFWVWYIQVAVGKWSILLLGNVVLTYPGTDPWVMWQCGKHPLWLCVSWVVSSLNTSTSEQLLQAHQLLSWILATAPVFKLQSTGAEHHHHHSSPLFLCCSI